MKIKTERLNIIPFTIDMAESVHQNSLDDDNRKFVPDEVFETKEAAEMVLKSLISFYGKDRMPKVYAILLHDGQQIGHVQAAPIRKGWEIGYHIGKAFTGKGYATEALRAFLPAIMDKLGIKEIAGICHVGNMASRKVMENCGFTLQAERLGLYQWKIKKIRKYKYVRQAQHEE
ncbi:MAG: GNAT family N-acetyltransferase [Defluviitaleaceae bacterium]|nr:GNAT family N-acetyltransferase [Defluviitaleaceae bacterium]